MCFSFMHEIKISVLFSLSLITRVPIYFDFDDIKSLKDKSFLLSSLPLVAFLNALFTYLVCIVVLKLGFNLFVVSVFGFLFYLWFGWMFHFDGFIDFVDAWGSYTVGERFIEILKDSRVGAFGVAFAVGVIALWIGLLFEAIKVKGLFLYLSIVASGGRLSALWLAFLSDRHINSKGMAFYFIPLSLRTIITGNIFFILVNGFLFYIFLSDLSKLFLVLLILDGIALLVAYCIKRVVFMRIDGINGDILGATEVISELCIGFVFLSLFKVFSF